MDLQGLDQYALLVDQAISSNKNYGEVVVELEKASQSIQNAEKDGRTGGLEQPKMQLAQAKAALEAGNWDKAVVNAVKARKAADSATPFTGGVFT